MKDALFTFHFILPPSYFILPQTPSLTVGLPPSAVVFLWRCLNLNRADSFFNRKKRDDGGRGQARLPDL
jgi:hypothetical protein